MFGRPSGSPNNLEITSAIELELAQVVNKPSYPVNQEDGKNLT